MQMAITYSRTSCFRKSAETLALRYAVNSIGPMNLFSCNIYTRQALSRRRQRQPQQQQHNTMVDILFSILCHVLSFPPSSRNRTMAIRLLVVDQIQSKSEVCHLNNKVRWQTLKFGGAIRPIVGSAVAFFAPFLVVDKIKL